MAKIFPKSRGVIGFEGNGHDCTVRAAVNSSNFLTYEEVHATLRKYGREHGKGAFFGSILKAYLELGFRYVGTHGTTNGAEYEVSVASSILKQEFEAKRGMTLGRFIKENPVGRFVCLNRKHAFAVIDGKLIDTTALPAGTYISSVFKKVEVAV